MSTKDLNQLAKEVHQANIKWWQNIDTGEPIKRNRFELLALVISEISECLEGERKNLMDDHLPHRKMAEVELADAKIRLLDFAAGFGVLLHESDGEIFIPENKGEALFHIIQCVCDIAMEEIGIIINEDYDGDTSYAIQMIDAYSKKHGYDIDGAFTEKMAYNATRADHSHEARRIAGGKQF